MLRAQQTIIRRFQNCRVIEGGLLSGHDGIWRGIRAPNSAMWHFRAPNSAMWHFIIARRFSVNPTNLQEIPRRAEDHPFFLVNTGWHKNWSKSAFFLKTLIIRAYPVHSLPSQIDPVIFVIAVGLCPRCPANLHKIVKPDYDSKPNSQTVGSLLSSGEVEGLF